MKVFQIKTPAFILTKMTSADGDKYYQLSNNDNVMKFVTGTALSREESDKMLGQILRDNGTNDYFGRYLIEEIKTGALVGAAKLEAYGTEVEIGYRIMEEYWGKGVATSIAKSLIRFSLKTFKPTAVIAFVNIRNAASIRVLEKAGMMNVESIEDIDEEKFKFSYSPKTNSIMKKALYIILGLIGIFLIAAFIMPKDYAVEREITINKPKAEVFEYLKSLKNQDNWSVWMKMDPNIKKTYKGTDGTIGFTSMWEGNDDVGKGEQEIKKISEGERIDTELRFIKPFESNNDAYMITENAGENQTKVKWGFSGKMPYPMNAMLPFMGMEKSVGSDFANGLKNLKEILEK
ncbi:GNAT family N-acetyltransferase [Dyadobacter sp. CY356]|uniref:GNAT family N-acetyltransferase n=1 Tax=Dyadobacter sp. CY356 TaxID=2906442 RepID=UPI001F2C4F9A|nr:GNAT family N-acetyltransferase [Dyadobacter sp. CY356]MCF0059007.1 GNAT family N-acetyltransferase [Dyadobacter sp. CY356]